MEIGISSLGHLIDLGNSGNFESLDDYLIKATDNCLNFAEKNDINVVEIVIDPPMILNSDNWQQFLDLIRSYSIKIQIHGPFINVNLCSNNTLISDASVKSYIESAKICKKLGAKILTIHPGTGDALIKSLRDFNKINLINALYRLLDFTNTLEITLCIENMSTKSNMLLDENEIISFFNRVYRSELYFTYDTSHFYTTNGDIKLLWEKMHNKIRNIHIVDNFSKETDTHPPLGTGKIDFNEIFSLINQYSYDGALIIELSSSKHLIQSIDFVKNFI
ncbi:MAG: sugar phosphate isomerase/epimerase family protein [Promethearchaeota archaeon]